jgi:hypothetical protein
MVALPTTGEDERVIDSDGPRLRLLLCKTCGSIEPLPWYEGPAEYDDTLIYRTSQHKFASGDAHEMPVINGTPAGIATVAESTWEDATLQRKVIEQINAAVNGGDTGLGSRMYNLRSTFKDDALACWKKHNRTTNCGDYRSDRMRLVPDTRGERKELGLEVKASRRPSTSLCVFCPYHSVVMQRARKEQGFY